MQRMNARWLSTAAALSLAVLAAGCGDKLLGISATIQVTPDMLAFGQAGVGDPQQIRVSVTNLGSAALLVTNIKVATDPNNELTVSDQLLTDCSDQPRSGGTTLAPGECGRFTVTWSPLSAHQAAGSVEVDSDDAQTPVVTLPVTGNAASPLLQICVVEADGGVDNSDCSDLSANPQVIPTVNFGTSLPGSPVTRTVRLTNQGSAALDFSPAPTLATTAGAAPQFSLAGTIPGAMLAPGDHADITVTANPTGAGSITGELDVASNDTRNVKVPVPLLVFVAGGQVCVNPPAGLDFGTVTVGQSQKLSLTMTNCGNVDLDVSALTFAPFAPTTSQFTITTGTLPAAGSTFATGAMIALTITYSPTVVQSDKASIDYLFSVGTDAIQGSIPIVGKAAAAMCGSSGAADPVAKIATSYGTTQNGNFTTFTPTATPSPVVPLDWVKLNASGSTVSAGTPTYTWQLVSQPAGSTTTLQGSGVQVTMQALVSGAYVISLTVKDASACIGTTMVTINVVPQGDVHIELTWAESCGDLDLHYVRPGHTICDLDDCAYYNTSTSWGAKLDHDDLWGNGPENITQAAPADGTPYQVWVYYYSSTPDGGGGSGTCSTTHPTVNIYFQGTLSKTYTLTGGFTNHQAWHVADVTVANQASSFSVAAGATTPVAGGACTD